MPEIITKSKVVPADKDWEFVVKATLIVRDIMLGNRKLDEMGWHEEALGRNAIVGGFQGQRMWTDWLPNGDFMEAITSSTFDWNGKRQPIRFATENDNLNGISMLLGHLVSNKAPLLLTMSVPIGVLKPASVSAASVRPALRRTDLSI